MRSPRQPGPGQRICDGYRSTGAGAAGKQSLHTTGSFSWTPKPIKSTTRSQHTTEYLLGRRYSIYFNRSTKYTSNEFRYADKATRCDAADTPTPYTTGNALKLISIEHVTNYRNNIIFERPSGARPWPPLKLTWKSNTVCVNLNTCICTENLLEQLSLHKVDSCSIECANASKIRIWFRIFFMWISVSFQGILTFSCNR